MFWMYKGHVKKKREGIKGSNSIHMYLGCCRRAYFFFIGLLFYMGFLAIQQLNLEKPLYSSNSVITSCTAKS